MKNHLDNVKNTKKHKTLKMNILKNQPGIFLKIALLKQDKT